MHVLPVDAKVPPPGYRRTGLNFRFEPNRFPAADGRYIAPRAVLGQDVGCIVTGQHIPGDRWLWDGRINFDDESTTRFWRTTVRASVGS